MYIFIWFFLIFKIPELQIHVYIYLGFLSLEHRIYRYTYIFIWFFLSLEYRIYFICVGAGLALLVLVLIACCCLKNGKSKLKRANKNSVHGVTNHAMVNVLLVLINHFTLCFFIYVILKQLLILRNWKVCHGLVLSFIQLT